jgi:hypothetical protein
MSFGNSAKFPHSKIFNAYASKDYYTVLETFHGELYQADIFGENTKVQDTCPQSNAMVTISEAHSKVRLNMKHHQLTSKPQGYLMPLNG